MKVFELRKAFDDQHSPFTRGDEKENEKNAREAAEKVLKEQIKESIGETRYAAYERAQNYEFQQMLRSATRGALGAPQAVQAWEMKQAAEQQAKELRGRSDMTAQDRNAALLAIRQETEASLKGALGEKGWDEYNRPMNTSWLQRMSPNTTLPPPVKVQ
jgi:hypothetical protein